MTAAFGAILALTMAGGAQPAESPAHLRIGSRVRVESSAAPSRLVGTLIDVREDALVLRRSSDPPSLVPFSAISKLEVNTGRTSQAARGLMIGAAVGAMPGLLLTWGDEPESKASPAAVAVLGAAGGALVGGAIGWVFKTDRWQTIDVPKLGMTFVPRRGAAVSIRLTWGRGKRG